MPRLDIEHQRGNHCGSTSLRDLSAYYGWGFDEPTCFGLASGLGFSYLRLDDSPERMFFGRPSWLERAFFENLAIEHELHEGESFERAWAAIRNRIDGGDSVMIFTDLYYLDYYDTDTHFAPHSLLVVGYDDGHAHLADSEFDAIQTLPLERLRAALTSDHVVPLQCRYLTVETPRPTVEFSAAVEDAISETATYMLDPEQASHDAGAFGEQGIPAMRALATELPSWSALDDPKWTARFAYQNIERRGTGGGAFRRMYASFLDRVVDETAVTVDAVANADGIATEWTNVGELLYEASETEESNERDQRFREAGERVAALADHEEALYETLLRACT